MRKIFVLLAALILSSCAETPQTRIAYGAFSTYVPTAELDDAVIVSFQQIAFKTKDGRTFGGRPVSSESEELPEDFDITQFPIYALMLKPVPEGKDYSEHMKRVASETDYLYGVAKNSQIFKTDTLTIYFSCKDSKCLAYAVKDGIKDHILEVDETGVTKEEFETLLHNNIN